MTFWDKYEHLCFERGISPTGTEMQSVTGVSSAAITNWKTRNSKPKDYKIFSALADYFHVDVRYLLGLINSPFGDDIIEKGMDLLSDYCDINSFDDDNGVGQEYVVIWEGKSHNYQEHEFKQLCENVCIAVNDSKAYAIERLCREVFNNEVFPIDVWDILLGKITNTLTEEEQTFLDKFRKLSADGKTIVNAAIIQELRRQE